MKGTCSCKGGEENRLVRSAPRPKQTDGQETETPCKEGGGIDSTERSLAKAG